STKPSSATISTGAAAGTSASVSSYSSAGSSIAHLRPFVSTNVKLPAQHPVSEPDDARWVRNESSVVDLGRRARRLHGRRHAAHVVRHRRARRRGALRRLARRVVRVRGAAAAGLREPAGAGGGAAGPLRGAHARGRRGAG